MRRTWLPWTRKEEHGSAGIPHTEALRQKQPCVQGRDQKSSGASHILRSKCPILLRCTAPCSQPYFRLLNQSTQLQTQWSILALMIGTAAPPTAFSFILTNSWNIPLVGHSGDFPPTWPSQSIVALLSVTVNQLCLALKLKISKTKIYG